MPAQVGYCLLPFEPMSWHRPDDDFAAIADGFREIKKAGFTAVEGTAKVSSGLDLARRNMADDEFPGKPMIRTDVDFLHRIGRHLALSEELGIALTTLYSTGEFVNPKTQELEWDHLVVLGRIFAASGIPFMCLTAGSYRQGRFDEDLDELARFMEHLGAEVGRFGVRLAVHPHTRTCLETPEQIDRFLAATTADNVSLLLDTAHVVAGGGDPVDVARRHRERIGYVHLKDIVAPAPGQDLRLDGAYRKAFRNVGEGDVDFDAVLSALDVSRFDGPVMAELDVSPDPVSDVARVRDVLVKDLGLALT